MPYVVQLRADVLRQYCNELGWDVDTLADAAERNRNTIYRAMRGGHVGSELIAACAALFGPESLHDLLIFGHSSGREIGPPVPRRPFAPRLARRDDAA